MQVCRLNNFVELYNAGNTRGKSTDGDTVELKNTPRTTDDKTDGDASHSLKDGVRPTHDNSAESGAAHGVNTTGGSETIGNVKALKFCILIN